MDTLVMALVLVLVASSTSLPFAATGVLFPRESFAAVVLASAAGTLAVVLASAAGTSAVGTSAEEAEVDTSAEAEEVAADPSAMAAELQQHQLRQQASAS